jgi:hypothetical protein
VQVFFTSNAGYSNYSSLQAQFVRRAKSGPHIVASYTLSHSLDNISSDAFLNNIPARFVSRHDGYGPSDFDTRHTVSVGLAYVLGKVSKRHMVRTFLSDWSIDPIEIVRSAPPVDAVLVRTMGFANYSFRPDLVDGVSPYIDDPNVPGGRRFNPQVVAVPDTNRQGNIGRNFFRGFALFQTDCGVGRQFSITNGTKLLARVEAFNVFNHPNFSPPSGQLGRIGPHGMLLPQPSFGISQAMLGQGLQADSTGSGYSPLYQIGTARSLQLALRVEF